MPSSWSSSEEGISVYFFVFSSLLALVLVLSKLLHDRKVLASILPEAGMVLLVGMLAGFIVNLFTPASDDAAIADNDGEEQEAEASEDIAESLLSFSPNVFFVALLPPIIFNSGYHLRRELFFRHITPILLLSCLGTTISALTVAIMLKLLANAGLTGEDFDPTFTELLTFGALISATDPVSTLAVFQTKRVDPHLFYLVFGESVMNDAVGLVLFDAFSKFVVRDNGAGKVILGIIAFLLDFAFIFLGSLCLGILCGIGGALLLKHVDMRETKLLELSLFIMIMYVPFLVAEMFLMSGIVTILFTGIAARHYVVPNLSSSTAANADVLFRLTAHLAETSIFLELGLSVFGTSFGKAFLLRFISWACLACLVGRALNVYPIVLSYNATLRRTEGFHQLPGHHDETGDVEMTEGAPETNGDSERTAASGSESRQEAPHADSALDPSVLRDQAISAKTAHMLWYSGLRGAVAYACVRTFPNTFGHRREFVVTTMAIVLLTVFFLGGTTELVLNCLNIDMGIDEDSYVESRKHEDEVTGFVSRMENRYIWHLVVRDDSGDESTEDDVGHEDGPQSRDGIERRNSFPFHEHVETTASGDVRVMRDTQLTPERRRVSLYDYGRGPSNSS